MHSIEEERKESEKDEKEKQYRRRKVFFASRLEEVQNFESYSYFHSFHSHIQRITRSCFFERKKKLKGKK